jgi:uncharacterized membrane protein YsdA (DUF1294 family)
MCRGGGGSQRAAFTIAAMLTLWLLLVICASLASLGLYGLDKKAALKHERRVPEQTLHLLALVGGWPGAWLAQKAFRHKTSKSSFQRVFWLTALAHSLASALLFSL